MIIKSRRQFVRTLAFAAGASMFASKVSAQEEDLPNVFISPCGKPFRAPLGAPYPVVDWFKEADKNGDGKLDHGEFMADTEAFFKVLDLRGNGFLDDYDIAVYERRIVPEILGLQAMSALGLKPRLWLVQGPGGMGGGGGETFAPAPDADNSQSKEPKTLDESKVGAAPFSFFNAPEPVTAADTQFRGGVTKDDFMALGDRHFTALDADNLGYLTLAKLPRTEAQRVNERALHKRF